MFLNYDEFYLTSDKKSLGKILVATRLAPECGIRESFTRRSSGACKRTQVHILGRVLPYEYEIHNACGTREPRDATRSLSSSFSLFLSSLPHARGESGGGTLVFTPSTPVATTSLRWSMVAQRSMPSSGPSMLRPHRACRSS